MAKPKHGQWYNYTRQTSPDSPLHHKPRAHACSPSFPSQAVLSALAVIATAPSVVAGSPVPPPTPPAFLCPFIERDNIITSADTFPAPSTPTPSSSAPPSPSSTHSTKAQIIADRYVEGTDSSWRKTSLWTLYGSTCCSDSMTASTSTQPYSSQTPTPTSSNATTSAFDTSALPAGWNSANTSSSSTDSTIILALAIVLASCICVFIIGCLVWRRRKKRARDIERKLGHKHNVRDHSPNGTHEEDARGKMRVWARASARWKSNIRQSARRRRKRPLASSMVSRPLSPTFGDARVSVDTPSAPSRRGSLTANEPDLSRPDTDSCLDVGLTDIQYDTPRPVSPPTYAPRFSPPPPNSAACHPSSPPSVQRSNLPSSVEDELLAYIPRSAGHVATDDKAELARIRELASSPPAVTDGADGNTTRSISAPEWHQVEDEDVDPNEVPMAFHNFGFPPSFPPLPKSDVPFGYLDDYPLHYGKADDILVSSVPGPSDSLFGASPSVPPIDYPHLEPSAPSLEGEDDLFQDWDTASSYTSTSVGHDPTLARVAESSTSPTVPISRTSFPLSRASAARNSILPQYHP